MRLHHIVVYSGVISPTNHVTMMAPHLLNPGYVRTQGKTHILAGADDLIFIVVLLPPVYALKSCSYYIISEGSTHIWDDYYPKEVL